MIKDILTARNVSSVLYASANIFDTREAVEIQYVLNGIARPADISRLKAALTTEMMGIQAEDLVGGEFESRWWEIRLARFREYFQIWDQQGFIRMLGLFLVRENVKERLLSFPDGERRLTNLMHLAELLHRQSADNRVGMAGLLKWLSEQRDPMTPRLEENQLRLESDENAVKIVTIHKSKGLEYPVVFCPFGWEGSLLNDPEFTFHDIDDNLRLTLDLGSDSRTQNIALARNELLSENIRLLYVAVTRAKEKCYLAWGRINTADTSALAYLLHRETDQPVKSHTADQALLIKEHLKAKTNAELLQELHQLSEKSANSIAVVPLPLSPDSDRPIASRPEADEALICRNFTAKIDRSWRISSYSSLVTTGASDVDQPDRDASPAQLEANRIPSSDDLKPESDSDDLSIFSFPRGSRAGSFFHDIFEHCDFATNQSDHLQGLVSGKLKQYGYDLKWLNTVCQTVSAVLSASLQPHLPQLKLSSLEAIDRINEMAFYYPLNSVAPSDLQKLFKKFGGNNKFEDFPAHLERLSFAPTLGFMKGYIDMVFQHQKRFYLLDWKSNHLGSTLESYNLTSVCKSMEANYYVLQYHIYALALHQYIRLQKPDYRYENDFGGVFYIFIRGVDDTRGADYGIFYDVPDPDLIHAMAQALIPGYN
jgi:exodeoxyribonuclease V beta subunit